MIFGVKSNQDGDFCLCCNAKVNLNLYDFCPKCGNALNQKSNAFKEQQYKKIKIELLDELTNEICDEKSLKVILNKLKNL